VHIKNFPYLTTIRRFSHLRFEDGSRQGKIADFTRYSFKMLSHFIFTS
jgi:hypothetical protein